MTKSILDQARAAVEPQMKAIAERHAKNLNHLSETMQGEPLDEIKAELTALYLAFGNDNKLEEPGLTKYAEQVRDGGRFNVNYTNPF